MAFVKRKADKNYRCDIIFSQFLTLACQEFTFSSLPLDIEMPPRYIKCINSVNTLLTYLVQCMLRFPEVFEDSAVLAAE